jgi:hypothetical protein
VSILLALTRPIALPLSLLILVHGLLRWRQRGTEPFAVAERRRWLMAVVVSGASFGLWPLICALRTGEVDGFLTTQQAWTRSYPGDGTWLLTLLHDPTGRAAMVAIGATVIGVAVVARPGAGGWGSDLRWWVPLYAVYLLATASPVASSVRYAILAVVPWWPSTDQGAAMTGTRKLVTAGFVVAFGVLCQVAWVRYCYVLGPDQAMFP